MSINKDKSVQFAGRTLIVSQVNNSLRVNLRIAEVQAAEISKLAERPISPLEENYYFGVYPKLAVCTTTEDGSLIPTADEMLDNGDVDETNNWYVTAQEINPWLFPSESNTPQDAPAEVIAEEEKKKRTRSKRAIQPSA